MSVDQNKSTWFINYKMPGYRKLLFEIKRNSFKRRIRSRIEVTHILPSLNIQTHHQIEHEPINSENEFQLNENLTSRLENSSESEDENNSSLDYDNEYNHRFNLTNENGSNSDPSEKVGTYELLQFLRRWSLRNNIKMSALNEILMFFKSHGYPRIPMDSRTVLNTPNNISFIDIRPGKYVNIGIRAGLDRILANVKQLPMEISLDFNVDGLPISKSSNSSFWVILGKSSISKTIFVIGIYHGFNKPKNFNEFLRPFVDELKDICISFSYKNHQINIKIGNFICDTPARCSILGIKSHTAYFGCNRCTQEGEHIKNRMTFPELVATRRTDVSFRNKLDEHHHNVTSILEELDINMVEQFPYDYLHVVCLGVMKRFLRMWMVGTSESLLSSREIEKISSRLEKIALHQPSEFQRKLRPLSQMSYFKGTEYRCFLLYAAPFVLKDALSDDKYNHFLLLHVAIRLLSTTNLPANLISLSQTILNEFIIGVKCLYSSHHIIFNVHALSHLPEDVRKNGNLNLFSSFPFESFMYQIKSLLRKNSQPLSQIYNRLIELNGIPEKETDCNELEFPIMKCKTNITTNGRTKTIFGEIVFKDFRLNSNKRDCWFLMENGNIIKFIHATKSSSGLYIFGSASPQKSSLFNLPISSDKLDIYKSDLLLERAKYWKIDAVVKKLFAMEADDIDYRAYFPLIHL